MFFTHGCQNPETQILLQIVNVKKVTLNDDLKNPCLSSSLINRTDVGSRCQTLSCLSTEANVLQFVSLNSIYIS